MATKKIQILDSIIKQAENSDTLDGKHAEDFALASSFNELKNLVGDTQVSTQIENAIASSAKVQIITWEADD